MQKIIVLDRDGVINIDRDDYIKNVDEWIAEPGSIEAIKRLKQAGWTVAVATNQSGIKRGYYTRAGMSEIHQKMQDLLGEFGVDWISYSPYLGDDNSPSRKPGSGMLTAIELRYGRSLAGAPMVGDTTKDMQAALSKQMKPYLVKTGKGAVIVASAHAILSEYDIPVYDNLAAVVEAILK
ncbi:MAG: D-glycero-D-manno-heptose 1,7-bisphosphate phosphatase [Thiomicrorhabdus sp.]|nr:MAG: D-glycero-D-manno-heptose 1,7-bisphosphate phosphatase [Thiomicrorhabdus sp.]